jgi:hypothetical protein
MLLSIDSVEWNNSENAIYVEYSIKDGKDWTEYEKEDDDIAGDALVFDEGVSSLDSVIVLSAVAGAADGVWGGTHHKELIVDLGDAWAEDQPNGLPGEWYFQVLDTDDEKDWYLWIDKDEDDDAYGWPIFDMAETCNDEGWDDSMDYCPCAASATVKTEFENDVWFCAEDTVVTVAGATDSGAEDPIWIGLSEDGDMLDWVGEPLDGNVSSVFVGVEGCEACELSGSKGDCEDIAEGEEDGTLISLSGAMIEVEGDEIEEPEDSNNESDVVTKVSMTIPIDELRPTIFFGIEETQNTSSVQITEAMVGQVVEIGGVDVTVEDFGVTTTAGGVVSAGGEVSVQCPAVTGTCPAVEVPTKEPANIGYKLVVVETSVDTSKNLVLIGGPSVNSLTSQYTTVDELCSEAVVKLVAANRLLVAGCEAADTKAAAEALMSWLSANV